MKKADPVYQDIVYVKQKKTDRIMYVDQIFSVGEQTYRTRDGLVFDFSGDPLHGTATTYPDCKAYICDTESHKFYSRLYEKRKAR